MSFDPWISEWGNPPLMLGKSELSGACEQIAGVLTVQVSKHC
jgi:hypothetical protein